MRIVEKTLLVCHAIWNPFNEWYHLKISFWQRSPSLSRADEFNYISKLLSDHRFTSLGSTGRTDYEIASWLLVACGGRIYESYKPEILWYICNCGLQMAQLKLSVLLKFYPDRSKIPPTKPLLFLFMSNSRRNIKKDVHVNENLSYRSSILIMLLNRSYISSFIGAMIWRVTISKVLPICFSYQYYTY